MPACQETSLEAAVKQYEFLLLDTCILIAEFKHGIGENPTWKPVLPAISRDQRRSSLIVLWEFFHNRSGVPIGGSLKVARKKWMDRQGIVAVDPTAGAAASFRSLLQVGNPPPGLADSLLAAEAVARKWPLVTSNHKHFASVTGLRLVAIQQAPLP